MECNLRLKVRVVEIMEEHGGRNFNMVALTGGRVDKAQFRVSERDLNGNRAGFA